MPAPHMRTFVHVRIFGFGRLRCCPPMQDACQSEVPGSRARASAQLFAGSSKTKVDVISNEKTWRLLSRKLVMMIVALMRYHVFIIVNL